MYFKYNSEKNSYASSVKAFHVQTESTQNKRKQSMAGHDCNLKSMKIEVEVSCV